MDLHRQVPVMQLGVHYRVADLAGEQPAGAKYWLRYWDKCVFFAKRTEAEAEQAKLPYHQQEDSFVEALRQ